MIEPSKRGLEINPLEGSLPLRTPAFPLFGPRPPGRAESQEVIITRRRRQIIEGTRLRFTPYVGGEDSTELFFEPASVAFIRIGKDFRDAGEEEESQRITPLFPEIDNVPINEDPPPSFDISSRSNASIWLCTGRTKCGTLIPTGFDPEARLEIYNRGEKPERVRGENATLIAEMDFLDSDGAKSIDPDTAVYYWQSDWPVPYFCDDDDSSEFESDPFGSDFSDFSSDELSDVPNDSSDSGSDPDCAWEVSPKVWYGKRTCYQRYPSRGSVTIGVALGVKIGARIRNNCTNIYAYISVDNGGVPRSDLLDAGQIVTADGEIKVPLTKRANELTLAFFFPDTPCKVDQKVTVRVVSEDQDPVAADNECCGEGTAGSKTFSIGLWPGWCEYGTDGSSCGSTILP